MVREIREYKGKNNNKNIELIENNKGKYSKIEQIEKNMIHNFRMWINLGCKYNNNYSYIYNNYI